MVPTKDADVSRDHLMNHVGVKMLEVEVRLLEVETQSVDIFSMVWLGLLHPTVSL